MQHREHAEGGGSDAAEQPDGDEQPIATVAAADDDREADGDEEDGEKRGAESLARYQTPRGLARIGQAHAAWRDLTWNQAAVAS